MFNSEKVLHMSYANYQGKGSSSCVRSEDHLLTSTIEALIEKFRNSGVMEERESWRPKIFYSSGLRQGELEPFPRTSLAAVHLSSLTPLQLPTTTSVSNDPSKMAARRGYSPPTLLTTRAMATPSDYRICHHHPQMTNAAIRGKLNPVEPLHQDIVLTDRTLPFFFAVRLPYPSTRSPIHLILLMLVGHRHGTLFGAFSLT
jgi:hypothetical protein